MDQERFTYTEFRVASDRRTVEFEFRLEHDTQTYTLVETMAFPRDLKDTNTQRRSLRALHLALGISYYKTFLPPHIIHPYAMDEQEAAFWNDIWRNGLGEFLYNNKLELSLLATFSAQDGLRFAHEDSHEDYSGALLGIGGGKDSIVAGELLRDLNIPLTGFVMATGEQLGQAGNVAETMGIELLAVQRRLDTQLLKLQELPGAYIGHVPISLIFGLIGASLAISNNSSYVIVANEASASIPRITWEGRAINHQWSKSFGFEKSLQAFIQHVISPDITYFSAIRPLSSIGVAKSFSKYPQYFEVFTSDNFVFRIDPARRPPGRWSLESPKSLSSYILLAPWISNEEVHRIFAMDLFGDESLARPFLELTGVEGEPPLDCVGTVDELVLSMNLLAASGRYSDTTLMRLAQERGVIRSDDWQQKLQDLLALQSGEAFPPELRESILQNLQKQVAA